MLRNYSLLILSFCLFVTSAFAQKGKAKFTLEDIFYSPKFHADGIYGIQMYGDGQHYTRLGEDTTNDAAIIELYNFREAAAEKTIFNQSQTKGLPKSFNLENYEVSKSGNTILLNGNSTHVYRHSATADYYIYNARNRSARPVFNGRQIFFATLSPDERYVAFVHNNNLYYQDVMGDSAVQITKDGEMNAIINGKTDWVYEEEFALVKAFFWSPNSDRIAYYKFDERPVPQISIPVYDSIYPSPYTYRYPKAGSPNSDVSIWVYNIKGDTSRKMPLTGDTSYYIPRVSWTQDNNELAIVRLNRLQNHYELYMVDVTSDKSKLAYEERSETWVDVTDYLYFFKDGQFLIASEREGWMQLYVYDPDAGLIRKLTTDSVEITELVGVDEARSKIYFRVASPTPMDRTLFSINRDGSGLKPVINNNEGIQDAMFSSDFSHFIFTTADSKTPPVSSVYTWEGQKLQTLVDNQKLRERLQAYTLIEKEFFQVPGANGELLNAWIMKPAKMKKKEKHPLLMYVYGGPGNQTVQRSWNSGYDWWFQYLVQEKGFVVVSVDNRGTGGRGADFKKSTYRRLGLNESDDQIAAARHLATFSYIDPARIAIFGWSFGGYQAALNIMRAPDVFNTAISVAPVTDWRFYDNIYTERFMQRPADNPEGYDKTSVLTYVPQLRGNLLVVHGSFDDNVHPQNTFELISALVQADKRFDSEFYTDKNHSIYGGKTRLHLFRRITKYLEDNMLKEQ